MPLSPSTSVVASVGATFSISRQTRNISSLVAMIPRSGDTLVLVPTAVGEDGR